MDDEPRAISGPLMLGLIALPVVFIWFLFRPGYARSTRIAAAAYAVTFPLLGIAALLLEAVTK
jgi:hypothetical protein